MTQKKSAKYFTSTIITKRLELSSDFPHRSHISRPNSVSLIIRVLKSKYFLRFQNMSYYKVQQVLVVILRDRKTRKIVDNKIQT